MSSTQEIVLSDGATISPSLVQQAESWEELLSLGLEVRRHKDLSQWILGLLALRVEIKYGEESLIKYAKEISVSSNSLRVYRYVVGKFLSSDPLFTPPERVSFGILQSIAGLPVDERQKLLEQAEDGDFSVERARVEVQKSQGKPVKPGFKVWYCEPCGKWHWQPSDIALWAPAHE